jgi:NAD(P)H-hydrate epimerase
MNADILVSSETARTLDSEAASDWALNPFALVESAGRSCADVFLDAYPDLFASPRIVVLAGNGNNSADAIVMLRSLLLREYVRPELSTIVMTRLPGTESKNPLSEALRSMKKMKVHVLVWDYAGEEAGRQAEDIFFHANIIIDGITGTGLKGLIRDSSAEIVEAINRLKKNNSMQNSASVSPFVVSIDLPSGASDTFMQGMPILKADAVLALEPKKLCLYKPVTRSYCGKIHSVGGIFPSDLIKKFEDARLETWETAASRISGIHPNAYKNERGIAEIRAGSQGATGAAKIAARGAQASGAGLVSLIVDTSIYPILAAGMSGIMVIPESTEEGSPAKKHSADAALLGPGWGTGPDRRSVLQRYLEKEKEGLPLILDADAIMLASNAVFSGNTILTPHPGEFEQYTGIKKEEILSDPLPILKRTAREKQAVILFKSHVLYIVSFDGRIGIIDGMAPVLAAGGSGDLLAGFCAGIAAREIAAQRKGQMRKFDGYECACAAAALLIEAGKKMQASQRFTDPLEIADIAASLAGEAWLE